MECEIGKILKNGIVEVDSTDQGFVYKNYDNFKRKKGICYISEYQVEDYNAKIKYHEKVIAGKDYETYKTIYQEVKRLFNDYKVKKRKMSIKSMVADIFDNLDWQPCETLTLEYLDGLDDNYFEDENDERN